MCRKSDLHLAVAVFAEASASGSALQLLCCPFGAVSSVSAWERFGAAIQARARAVRLPVCSRARLASGFWRRCS